MGKRSSCELGAVSLSDSLQDVHTKESLFDWIPQMRFSEHAICALFTSITYGRLILLIDHHTTKIFGTADNGPQVTLSVHDTAFFSKLRNGGSLALGEMYIAGGWDIEKGTLCELFQIFLRSRLEAKAKGSIVHRFFSYLSERKAIPLDVARAKKDIQQHYDLGNEFYSHMLDESMTYSCGYQITKTDSLAVMQENKYQRICNKLDLYRGGSLLDVGSGWGGMLIHVARRYPGVHCTGITLSEQQYAYTKAKILAAGLENQITVELRDYREMKGKFDFVVSIGMFEHVGVSQYQIFFKKISELLKQDGLALLHTIAQEESPYTGQDHWIQKYIFPGSRLPHLEEIAHHARQSHLTIGHVENLRPHYVETLRKWHENFVRNWDEIQFLGPQFNRRFYRIWEYYLQMCEACFINSYTELYQVGLCRRERWAFPTSFHF